MGVLKSHLQNEDDHFNFYSALCKMYISFDNLAATKKFRMAYLIKYNGDRTDFVSNLETFINKVGNYGCFCFNEGEFSPKGRGIPKDGIDQACKQLHQCQTCINMDFSQNTGSALDASCNDQYNFNLTNTDRGVGVECLNPKDTCQRARCECDKRFAIDLAAAYDLWDESLQWANSLQGRERECRAEKRIGPHVPRPKPTPNPNPNLGMQCCGTYPHRFPYNTMGGRRQCCGQSIIFRGGSKQCCGDNVARVTCREDQGQTSLFGYHNV